MERHYRASQQIQNLCTVHLLVLDVHVSWFSRAIVAVWVAVLERPANSLKCVIMSVQQVHLLSVLEIWAERDCLWLFTSARPWLCLLCRSRSKLFFPLLVDGRAVSDSISQNWVCDHNQRRSKGSRLVQVAYLCRCFREQMPACELPLTGFELGCWHRSDKKTIWHV